jgi:hypothetical protein
VSPREVTKRVRDAMARSRWPMLWVMLEVHQWSGDGRAGEGPAPAGVTGPAMRRVKQMLWNKAAGSSVLEGLDSTIRMTG